MEIFIKLNDQDPCSLKCESLLLEYLRKCFGKSLSVSPKAPHGFHLVYEKDDSYHSSLFEKITKKDGFAFEEEDGDIYFLAKTGFGLLNATVSYLEDVLGCRFFTHDDEYCPSLTSLPPISKKIYNPVFDMRTYIVGGTYDDDQSEGYFSPKLDELSKTHTVDVFTKVDEAHGGPVPYFARNTTHNFHFYCPYEKYGKDHPEFFKAISVNGVKMHTIDITSGLKDDGTLDEEAPISVAKIVIEELKKDIIANPWAEYFSLTQEDGPVYFDDEHNQALAKKYMRSGLLVRFCNAIIRSIHPWAKTNFGRDIKLMTIAYDYAKEPPVKEEDGKFIPLDPSVICDENLFIQLALFQNGHYSYFDPRQEKEIIRSMKGWKSVGTHFWFWGYDSDFSNYFTYFDSYATVKDNVLGLRDYGVNYVCLCASYDSFTNWQCNLDAYLYHRLLWDPSLDQDELKDEYLKHHYGPSAPFVQGVMDLFHDNYEKMIKDGHDVFFGTWGSSSYPENNPKEMLLSSTSLIEEGKKAIRASSYSPKEKRAFLTRLSAVEATPLNLLYLNFRSYYPEKGENERMKAKEAFVKAAKEGLIKNARERMSLEKYLQFVESPEYDIRPLWLHHRLCVPSVDKKGKAHYS